MKITIEKVLILRSVPMFSAIAESSLAHIATIATERTIDADEIIFEKGEIGRTMYVIINGKVRIHDEDKTMGILEKRDVFGELSVLDPEPRSATATTLEESNLLFLDQDALFELMSDDAAVGIGIIRSLVRRMRTLHA